MLKYKIPQIVTLTRIVCSNPTDFAYSWKRKEGVSKCAPSFFMHKAPTFTSWGFVIT